jgi:hypothetical protein
VAVTVNPATPEILEVPVAATISYGQTLAEATLTGGTAAVPGTFAFATPSLAPTAGTAKQTVVFTPVDTANYTQVNLEVLVTVNPATPAILEVPVAATISYGQTLAEATLTGGLSSVPGTFAFATPSLAPTAGTANQTVVFTPVDTANYTQATLELVVTVTPATPVILQIPVASTLTYGQQLAEATLTGGTATVPGTFAFANPLTVPIAGTTYHPVTFTATDSANYNTVTVLVKVKVVRKRPPSLASLAVTWDFDSWIDNFVGTGGDTAPGDDPDGDGIVNLMEYALADGYPDFSDRAILPLVSTVTDGDQQYLALTVRKNPYANDISWLVEVSGDLVDWNAGDGHTVVISDTADILIVRDTTPLGGSACRFLRLKVAADQP